MKKQVAFATVLVAEGYQVKLNTTALLTGDLNRTISKVLPFESKILLP